MPLHWLLLQYDPIDPIKFDSVEFSSMEIGSVEFDSARFVLQESCTIEIK